jgi:hypothetical protein
VLREPVGRIVSIYWYLKGSTWEKAYSPSHRNESVAKFLSAAERDWLVWSLAAVISSVKRCVQAHWLPGVRGLLCVWVCLFALLPPRDVKVVVPRGPKGGFLSAQGSSSSSGSAGGGSAGLIANPAEVYAAAR